MAAVDEIFAGDNKELDALRELFLKQVQTEHVSGLSALLAFNAGMAASLKDVLKNRDHALAQYQKAATLLDTRTNERQKWQTAQANAPSPRPASPSAGFKVPPLADVGFDATVSELYGEVNASTYRRPAGGAGPSGGGSGRAAARRAGTRAGTAATRRSPTC